jgi:hypothetical protein
MIGPFLKDRIVICSADAGPGSQKKSPALTMKKPPQELIDAFLKWYVRDPDFKKEDSYSKMITLDYLSGFFPKPFPQPYKIILIKGINIPFYFIKIFHQSMFP